MHIGLIGGIGPAATDFYHRGLIERHHASNIPLDLTIAYADVRTMSRNLSEKRPDRQAEIFARLVGRLKGAGAEAALLGGTDLFLAFTGRDCGFPVIDCADVHIDAIYRKSSA